jgi:hypothetical protein
MGGLDPGAFGMQSNIGNQHVEILESRRFFLILLDSYHFLFWEIPIRSSISTLWVRLLRRPMFAH